VVDDRPDHVTDKHRSVVDDRPRMVEAAGLVVIKKEA
jgi:hypothetical protein